MTQLEGDIVLTAFKPKTRSIYKPGKNVIVRSKPGYPKTEGILVRNLKKRPQMIWLAITPRPARPATTPPTASSPAADSREGPVVTPRGHERARAATLRAAFSRPLS